ncbi:HNH endonuclease [Campylobacter sp. CNRCH_2014_0184h]|uniref:HNH endonuclease n=1 Tax=Campylobacter sp. CNRCH_2014_0184h TaxID=2911602 RepID=UPI0021E69BF3|nr:HNH endonuclease signature motif containing protein [Campylobacter sp. CNRCH_2014_0184h]MCV3482759.1 HNH endonuclease [Campylobacter sp. CNRCH_2014_0184h]
MNIELILKPITDLRIKIGATLQHIDISYIKNFISAEEIKLLETQGIDVGINDVKVISDGTFSYKNRRVLIYIRDVSPLYKENDINSSLPRYHLCYCDAYQKMLSNNRKHRYVVSSRDDGIFWLNFFGFSNNTMIKTKSEERKLQVCMYCLRKLNWCNVNQVSNDKRLMIRNNFSLKDFFEKYPKNIINSKNHFSDKIAPLNIYSDDWNNISYDIRSKAQWKCQKCHRDFSKNRIGLDVHHINGQKNDNRLNNLMVLCKDCHSKEPMHEHYL